MATQQQLLDEFYAIVNQDADSSVYPSAGSGGSYVENLANRVQDRICREKKWPFLKSKKFWDTGVKTTTGAALTTASTEVAIVSATGWPTTVTDNAYALWVEGDVINFTGRTGLTLEGLTNIDIGHASGKEIELLYAMPSDFSHNPRLFVKAQSVDQFIRYELVMEDQDDTITNDTKNSDPAGFLYRWSIVTDKSGNEFIRISNQSVSNKAMFRYFKKATEMTDTTDETTIPDPFAMNVMPKLMAAEAMVQRADNPDGLGDSIGNQGGVELQKMRSYYMRREQEMQPRIQNVYRSGVPFRPRVNQRLR